MRNVRDIGRAGVRTRNVVRTWWSVVEYVCSVSRIVLGSVGCTCTSLIVLVVMSPLVRSVQVVPLSVVSHTRDPPTTTTTSGWARH
jgi:hypothetical protein